MKLFALTALVFLISHLSIVSVAQAPQTDTQPTIKGKVSYTMPQSAIDAEIGGSIVVAVSVDENGKPGRAWITAGPMWPCGKEPAKALLELSETVLAAVKSLKFAPATKNGKPISADIGLTLDLTNPKVGVAPVEVDPATGQPKSGSANVGALNKWALLAGRPRFPQRAKDLRHGGSVPVQIWIDEEGRVIRAGTLSGYLTLQDASREAACGSKFPQTKINGSPIKVSGFLVYNFVL